MRLNGLIRTFDVVTLKAACRRTTLFSPFFVLLFGAAVNLNWPMALLVPVGIAVPLTFGSAFVMEMIFERTTVFV